MLISHPDLTRPIPETFEPNLGGQNFLSCQEETSKEAKIDDFWPFVSLKYKFPALKHLKYLLWVLKWLFGPQE